MTGHTSAAGWAAASQCRSASIRGRCGRCGRCVNRSSACRRRGRVSGRLQIADEAQTVRFVRFMAVLQGNEKITSGGCLGTVPLKLFDALLLRANVLFEQLKLRVDLHDFTLEPDAASRLGAEQTSSPKASCCHRLTWRDVARPSVLVVV